jgi:hypothetical protein
MVTSATSGQRRWRQKQRTRQWRCHDDDVRRTGMLALSRWLGRNNDRWCQKQCTRQHNVDGRRCSCIGLMQGLEHFTGYCSWFMLSLGPHFIYSWVLLLAYVRFRTAHFNPGHHWSDVGTFFSVWGICILMPRWRCPWEDGYASDSIIIVLLSIVIFPGPSRTCCWNQNQDIWGLHQPQWQLPIPDESPHQVGLVIFLGDSAQDESTNPFKGYTESWA